MRGPFLFLLILFNTISSAYSSESGKLYLSGYVHAVFGVNFLAKQNYFSLDEESQNNEIELTSFQTETNSSSGYKFSLSSENGGVAKGNLKNLPYTIKLNQQVLSVSKKETPMSLKSNGKQSLRIKFPSVKENSQAPIGNYSDVIYLTINAN